MADSLRSYRQSSLGELLQAQASAQAAIDSLPDAVLVFGANGALVNANRIAEALLGVRLDAEAPLAPMPPEVRAVVDRVRDHVLAGEGPYVPKGFDEAVALVLGRRRARPASAGLAGATGRRAASSGPRWCYRT